MKKGYQVALLLVFGVLLAGFVYKPPITSGDVASWVQAIGSIAAIVAAVLIASDQHRKSESRAVADAQAEVENFLAGVREELDSSLAAYMDEVGTALEQNQAGQPLRFWWPAPPEPFKVYNATVSVIGRVRDDELRRQIISTYVVLGGLLLTWETHNRLLDESEKADEELTQPLADNSQEQARALRALSKLSTLIQYSAQLQGHHSVATMLVRETVDLIDRSLATTAQRRS